ncbi:MAG: hypothetical protein AAF611_06785 [Bacteroidota bacterium]
MSVTILLAKAIAKKKKSKCIKTAIAAKAIAHKKKAMKSKAICCALASKTKKKTSSIEKVMKLRAKAQQMQSVFTKVEKGVAALKNDNKKRAAGYFIEASLIGIRACTAQK